MGLLLENPKETRENRPVCRAISSQIKGFHAIGSTVPGKSPEMDPMRAEPWIQSPGRVDPMETERWIQWTGFRT